MEHRTRETEIRAREEDGNATRPELGWASLRSLGTIAAQGSTLHDPFTRRAI